VLAELDDQRQADIADAEDRDGGGRGGGGVVHARARDPFNRDCVRRSRSA
jgi:hypothetical protein